MDVAGNIHTFKTIIEHLIDSRDFAAVNALEHTSTALRSACADALLVGRMHAAIDTTNMSETNQPGFYMRQWFDDAQTLHRDFDLPAVIMTSSGDRITARYYQHGVMYKNHSTPVVQLFPKQTERMPRAIKNMRCSYSCARTSAMVP